MCVHETTGGGDRVSIKIFIIQKQYRIWRDKRAPLHRKCTQYIYIYLYGYTNIAYVFIMVFGRICSSDILFISFLFSVRFVRFLRLSFRTKEIENRSADRPKSYIHIYLFARNTRQKHLFPPSTRSDSRTTIYIIFLANLHSRRVRHGGKSKTETTRFRRVNWTRIARRGKILFLFFLSLSFSFSKTTLGNIGILCAYTRISTRRYPGSIYPYSRATLKSLRENIVTACPCARPIRAIKKPKHLPPPKKKINHSPPKMVCMYLI